MYPSILFDELEAIAPDAKPKHLHAYAALLIRTGGGRKRSHSRAGKAGIPSGAVSITCGELRRRFGRKGFEALNKRIGAIQFTHWSIEKGETRAFWLTPKGRELIEVSRAKAQSGVLNRLLNDAGRSIRKRDNGVFTSRDSRNCNAVTNAVITWAVPVNLEAIQFAIDAGILLLFPSITETRADLVEGAIRAVHVLALNDNVGYGLIPQEYREVPSGRLYGTSSLSLQNVPTEAKIIIFAGAHEYDFVNCQFQILRNVAEPFGIDCPTLQRYTDDASRFRAEMAERLGITAKEVKLCLISLMFGATQTVWHGGRFCQLIGEEKTSALLEDQDFDGLWLDIQEVSEVWRANAPRTPQGAIINVRGKACKGNAKQELAHLLQGMEAELLHLLNSEYGEHMLLLQHDGFVLDRYFDPAEMEALISYELGLDMPLTHEQLSLVPTASVHEAEIAESYKTQGLQDDSAA